MSILDVNFRNEVFPVFKELAGFADKIKKFNAICMVCKKDTARKPLRLRDNIPCSFNEDVLIERNDKNVQYVPVCNRCFYDSYKKFGV